MPSDWFGHRIVSGQFGYRIGENRGTTTAAILVCLHILGKYVRGLIREVKRRATALGAEVTAFVGFWLTAAALTLGLRFYRSRNEADPTF